MPHSNATRPSGRVLLTTGTRSRSVFPELYVFHNILLICHVWLKFRAGGVFPSGRQQGQEELGRDQQRAVP